MMVKNPKTVKVWLRKKNNQKMITVPAKSDIKVGNYIRITKKKTKRDFSLVEYNGGGLKDK